MVPDGHHEFYIVEYSNGINFKGAAHDYFSIHINENRKPKFFEYSMRYEMDELEKALHALADLHLAIIKKDIINVREFRLKKIVIDKTSTVV